MPSRIKQAPPHDLIRKKVFVLHEKGSAFHTSSHAQPLGRLLFAEKGVLHIRAAGKQLLVPACYCAWIPAKMEHEIWSGTNEHVIRNVYFESDFCANAAFHTLAVFNGSRLFCEMIRHTERWHSNPDEDIYELSFATVLRQMMPDEMKKTFTVALPTSADTSFQQAIEYIHANFAASITIADLLPIGNFSLRTLQRLFIRETGLSFSSYLKITRIIKAVELLSSSNMRSSEVAWEVGYSSIPTFNNTFREVTGYKPEHFQHANRQ